MTFDDRSPAELFMAKCKGGPRQRLGYRRFAIAAPAIRFTVEEYRPEAPLKKASGRMRRV
jgi:hypothetical protein